MYIYISREFDNDEDDDMMTRWYDDDDDTTMIMMRWWWYDDDNDDNDDDDKHDNDNETREGQDFFSSPTFVCRLMIKVFFVYIIQSHLSKTFSSFFFFFSFFPPKLLETSLFSSLFSPLCLSPAHWWFLVLFNCSPLVIPISLISCDKRKTVNTPFLLPPLPSP